MITGIILAMHYTPHIDLAFNSVEHIMRCNIWLVITLCSCKWCINVFIIVYLHMFRGLYYSSYSYPREMYGVVEF